MDFMSTKLLLDGYSISLVALSSVSELIAFPFIVRTRRHTSSKIYWRTRQMPCHQLGNVAREHLHASDLNGLVEVEAFQLTTSSGEAEAPRIGLDYQYIAACSAYTIRYLR
jgi:hypothetical protein